MSRFSLFFLTVSIGLLASLTTLISCGDTDDSDPIRPKVDEAKEGTYKVVVSMVGEISEYRPVVSVLGLYESRACTPLIGFIADSVYNAAIDNKTKLYSKYSLSIPYEKYPSLFTSTFSIVTIPQAHGLYNFKGYFNDHLLKDTIIKHEASELPVVFMVGNMSGDAYKAYKEAQS